MAKSTKKTAREKAEVVDRTVWCDTWRYPIYLAYVPDQDSWTETLNNLASKYGEEIEAEDYEYPDDCARTTVYYTEPAPTLLVTLQPGFDDPLGIMAMLCHESVHVYQVLRAKMKEKTPDDVGGPASEWEAYAIHSIFQVLVEAWEDVHGEKA